MLTFSLTLPYPPSANRIWRNVNGRVLLSRQGRAYRKAVAEVVTRERLGGLVRATDELSVHLVVLPPDNRRRDLDNVRKALLDALTYAGVWPDDSQVRRDSAEFGNVEPGGAVLVTVEVQRVGNSRRTNSGEQRRAA